MLHLEYKLVIICNDEEERKSHIISKLYLYRRPYMPTITDDENYRKYLADHCKDKMMVSDTRISASTVDYEK